MKQLRTAGAPLACYYCPTRARGLLKRSNSKSGCGWLGGGKQLTEFGIGAVPILVGAAISWSGYVNPQLSLVVWAVVVILLVGLSYRLPFAQPFLRKHRLVSSVLAFLVIVVGVGLIWYFRIYAPAEKKADEAAITSIANSPKAVSVTNSPGAVAVSGDVHIHNESKEPSTTTHRDPFFLRAVNMMVFDHHDPFFYCLYSARTTKQLAPVGLMLNLEATNERSTSAKVTRYLLEVQVDNSWLAVPSLPMDPPAVYYVRPPYSLKKAVVADFNKNTFDVEARAKNLPPGESLKGWMFFELPRGLRGESAKTIAGLRMTIDNNHGESQTSTLEFPKRKEYVNELSPADLKFLWPPMKVNLTALKIMPRVDFLAEVSAKQDGWR